MTRLSAPDAALLSIEFLTARVAPVPQGASLGIYEDRDLVRLRRDLRGRRALAACGLVGRSVCGVARRG